MDGQTDKYMDGQMYVCMMDGWMDDISKNEQMEGWMEGWMVGITSCPRIMSHHGKNHAQNHLRDHLTQCLHFTGRKQTQGAELAHRRPLR